VADLNDLAIFVKVATLGSFSVAARALAMPVSTVSRRITALEEQLGVTLLQRTTRKLSLTPQGRDYFAECSEPLGILADAERVLTQSQREPEGLIRVTGPVALRERPFLEFVSRFLKVHPRIKIELAITNEFVDFVRDNVDVGIRFGKLDDSSLIATKLGTTIRYVVATPGYLKGRALPVEPPDLEEHECVMLQAKNGEVDWELRSGKRAARVRVTGAISSRDFSSLSFFTLQGHGIGLLPSTYCTEALKKGTLVRVLPKWASPHFPVHAVYPTRKFMPSRLRAFLEALKAWQSPLWLRADA
jgi:DNA-binding transcriptional LysR family regulator